MIQLALGSILVGAIFGLRFKVMVVLPLTLVGCFTIVIGGIALGQSAATVAISLVAFAIALQVGFLFGSLTRMTMAALRTPRAAATRAAANRASMSSAR